VVVDPAADLVELAPLGCRVMTGFGSVWYALDLQPGARMGVFGAGAVGMAALIAAKLRKPDVLVAVDVVPEWFEQLDQPAHDMHSGVTVKPVIVH
jgi:aryl-alcohol dehydrogenase